jgi:hypothetical protein
VSALDEQLQRWHAAGLIDDATVAAIRSHEAQRTPLAAPPDRSRVTMQEVIAYAGVALALAGGALFVALHRDDLGLAGRLAVYVAVTVAAAVATGLLAGGGGAGRRAGAGTLMVAILGAGIAVGDTATSAGWLTVHHLYPSGAPGYPPYDDVDRSGNAALGLGAVAVLALAGTWWLRSGLLALLLTSGAFGATFTALGSRHAGGTTGPLVTLIPGVLQVALSLAGRLRDQPAGEVLRFLGTLVPAAALYIPESSLVVLLTALGGGISAAALLASPPLNSNALAVAGGLGLFGLVVDVGVRWFSGPLGLPLVLIAAGVALLGVAALIQRIVSRNRMRAAEALLTG